MMSKCMIFSQHVKVCKKSYFQTKTSFSAIQSNQAIFYDATRHCWFSVMVEMPDQKAASTHNSSLKFPNNEAFIQWRKVRISWLDETSLHGIRIEISLKFKDEIRVINKE